MLAWRRLSPSRVNGSTVTIEPKIEAFRARVAYRPCIETIIAFFHSRSLDKAIVRSSWEPGGATTLASNLGAKLLLYERRSVDGRSRAACYNVFSRLKRKKINARRIPVQLRTLEELVRPQPDMADVVDRLLNWMDLENDAMRKGEPQPAFQTRAGEPIFPDSEESRASDCQTRMIHTSCGNRLSAVLISYPLPGSEYDASFSRPVSS